jgi:hypothetical protein
MKKLKRMSQKEYLIRKMERYGLTSKDFAIDMRKHMTTKEVDSIFENLKNTKWGQKKLKRVI